MAAIDLTVKVTGKHTYYRLSYSRRYDAEEAYIYTFQDEAGTVFVWNTSTFFKVKTGERVDECGDTVDVFDAVNVGDEITIRATQKGEKEYKGVVQKVLTRVKCTSRSFKAESEAQREERRKSEKEQRKAEQLASIQGGDFVWRMPYRQFKEHYSDCETVIDSYEVNSFGEKVIKVIIREGRLKNSGVRGRHFAMYSFILSDDSKAAFRAVSEENARKQCAKLFPDMEIKELDKIYRF